MTAVGGDEVPSARRQGGEPFLGVMSGIGCLMVVWVGGLTLLRGR